jgi:hypothetical protein
VTYIPLDAVPSWAETGAALIRQYGAQVSVPAMDALKAMSKLKNIQQKSVQKSPKKASKLMKTDSSSRRIFLKK